MDELPTMEGPSNLKGKGADPGNWGGLDLTEGEMDVNVQAAELQKYEPLRKEKKPKPKKGKGKKAKLVKYATRDRSLAHHSCEENARRAICEEISGEH